MLHVGIVRVRNPAKDGTDQPRQKQMNTAGAGAAGREGTRTRRHAEREPHSKAIIPCTPGAQDRAKRKNREGHRLLRYRPPMHSRSPTSRINEELLDRKARQRNGTFDD